MAKKEIKEIDERTKRVTESTYNFFTEGDVNSQNHLCSDMPSWAAYALIEDLEREVYAYEKDIETGGLSPKDRANLVSKLNARKERLEQISKKPKVDKDRVFKVVGKGREGGSLGDKISESMFTYDDMQKGLADVRVEANRMLDPCIKLSPEEVEMASGCNIRLGKDKMVSRDDAIRVWRTGRLYLEEPSNAEILRH